MVYITQKFLFLAIMALMFSTPTQAASRWLNSRPHKPRDNTGPGSCIFGKERLMLGERRYPPGAGCVRRVCKSSRGIPRLQEQFCDPLPPVPPSCNVDSNPDRRYPDCCPTIKCPQGQVPPNKVAQRRVIVGNRRPLRPPAAVVNRPQHRQQQGVRRPQFQSPRNKIVPPQLNREFQRTQTMLQRPSFHLASSKVVPPQLNKEVKRTETLMAMGFAMDMPDFGHWIMGKNSNEGHQWPSQNAMISSQFSFLPPAVHTNSPNQVPNIPKYKENQITDVIYIEKQYPTPSLDHNVNTNNFDDEYGPNYDNKETYYIDKTSQQNSGNSRETAISDGIHHPHIIDNITTQKIYQPSSTPSYLPDIGDENIVQHRRRPTPPPAYSERTTTFSNSTNDGLREIPSSPLPNPKLSYKENYSETLLPESVTKVKSSPPTTVPSSSFKHSPVLPSLKLSETDHTNILPTLHLTQTTSTDQTWYLPISTTQDKFIEPKIVDRKTTTKPQIIKTTTSTPYTSYRDKNNLMRWSTYPPSYYYNRPPIPKLTVTMPTTTTTKSDILIPKQRKKKPSKYLDNFNLSRPKPISIRFSTKVPNTLSELSPTTNTLSQNSTEIPSSSIQTPSSINIYTPRLTISLNNSKKATNIRITTENPLSSKKVHSTTKTKLNSSNKSPKVKQTENIENSTTNISLTESQENTTRIKIRKRPNWFRTGHPKIKRRRTTTPPTSTKVEYTTWKRRKTIKDNEELTSSTESSITTESEIPTTVEPIQEKIITSTPESYETATPILNPNKQHILDLIYSGLDPSELIIGHEGEMNRKQFPINIMPGLDLDSSPSIIDPHLLSLLSRRGKSVPNLEENELIKERKKRSESTKHSTTKRGKPIFYLPRKKSLDFNVTFISNNDIQNDKNKHTLYSFSSKPDTNEKNSSNVPTEPDWSAHVPMLPEVYLDKSYFLSHNNYKVKNTLGSGTIVKDNINPHYHNISPPKEIRNNNITTSSPKNVTIPDFVTDINSVPFSVINDETASTTEISLYHIEGRENTKTELVLQEDYSSISYEDIPLKKMQGREIIDYDVNKDIQQSTEFRFRPTLKYFERIKAKTIQPLTNVPLPNYGDWAEKHSLGVMAYEPMRKQVTNQELATTGQRRYRPQKNTRGTTKLPTWNRNLENTRNQNKNINKKLDELTIQNPLEVISDTIGEISKTKIPHRHEIDKNSEKYELMNDKESSLGDYSNETIERDSFNGILIYEKESIPSMPTKVTNNHIRPLNSQEIDNQSNNTENRQTNEKERVPQKKLSDRDRSRATRWGGRRNSTSTFIDSLHNPTNSTIFNNTKAVDIPKRRVYIKRKPASSHNLLKIRKPINDEVLDSSKSRANSDSNESASPLLNPNKQHIFDLIYSGVDPSALIIGHEGPSVLGKSEVTETIVEDNSNPMPAINVRGNLPLYTPTSTLPYSSIPASNKPKRRRLIKQRKRLNDDSLTASDAAKDKDLYLSELNDKTDDLDKPFKINLHSNKPNLETRISGHQQQKVKQNVESAVEIDFKLPTPILGKRDEIDMIRKDVIKAKPFITSLISDRPRRLGPLKQRIRPTHEPLHKSKENMNEHSYLLESSDERLFTQRPNLRTRIVSSQQQNDGESIDSVGNNNSKLLSSVIALSEEIKPNFGPFSSKYNREHMLQSPVRRRNRPFGPGPSVAASVDNSRFVDYGPKSFSNNQDYNSDDLAPYIPQVMTLMPWRMGQGSTQNKDNSNYPGSYIPQGTTMKPLRLSQSSTRTWLASRPPSRRRLIKTRRQMRDSINN